jgi:hypothetical protein
MAFPMSPQDALNAFRAEFEVGGPPYNSPDVQIADFRGVWLDRSIVKLPEAEHFSQERCTRDHRVLDPGICAAFPAPDRSRRSRTAN